MTRYQRAYDALLADPSDDAVVRRAADDATGAERAGVLDTAAQLIRDGLVGRGSMRLTPVILDADEDNAVVASCQPQGQVAMFHADTGAPAENPNGGVSIFVYRLLRGDSRGWLVAQVQPYTASACPKLLEPSVR